jgi:hypothetical protein
MLQQLSDVRSDNRNVESASVDSVVEQWKGSLVSLFLWDDELKGVVRKRVRVTLHILSKSLAGQATRPLSLPRPASLHRYALDSN